jgi:osmotically-inducible protein OsmY
LAAFITVLFTLSLLGCASTPSQESTGEFMDDSLITSRVKAALFDEPSLKSFEIRVETFKGRVQLSGFVGTQAQIEKAVEVARKVQGVTQVSNDMRIK